MLKIQNLTAGYGGAPVLRNLSLTIPAGQLTAVIGPNGCGKSTFLKALAGILPQASGEITFQGENLRLPPKELARKIAYLPQNRPVPEITAENLVLHGRFPYLSYPRKYRPQDVDMARKAMEILGISYLADQKLKSLSGGQRQQVYLAMALAQDTPILLLDEPTTFLDIAHQLHLIRLARELCQAGKTPILVLHDLTPAMEYAEHLVVLDQGTLAGQGTPEEVLASGLPETVFGVQIRPIPTAAGQKYYYEK